MKNIICFRPNDFVLRIRSVVFYSNKNSMPGYLFADIPPAGSHHPSPARPLRGLFDWFGSRRFDVSDFFITEHTRPRPATVRAA